MKILYLDCGMGAAGDMLMAALLELCPDQEAVLEELNQMGIPGVEFRAEKTEKCGILGTHVSVLVHGEEEICEDAAGSFDGHNHGQNNPLHHHQEEMTEASSHHHAGTAENFSHHHAGMADIRAWIAELNVADKVKKDALAVYELIADAESRVHGKAVEDVHFHEVGMLDAVADVTGVCFLMERLGIARVFASAVHVGSGQVRCAHGILPVPAPATANLLEGVPVYGGNIQGELCTPTGAALLKYFVCRFGSMPPMAAEKIGYGMGKKDFPAANCVRAFIGSLRDSEPENPAETDSIVELRCNLDDMTGEEIGFACEMLFKEGALDVYTVGIGMKKSRPGVLLVCLCRAFDICRMEECIFCHTTTLGIRRVWCERSVLSRKVEQMETPWGAVRRKLSYFPGQEDVLREKLEYEDLCVIAQKTGMSIAQIRKRIGI